MQELPEIEDFKSLFINNTPLIDVRAPIEFAQGAFPAASNLPLMNDSEREAVGIMYKAQGQDKAIELGHQLVSGEIKTQRNQDWESFITKNPKAVLYCFRGGLRSRISQQWIAEQTGRPLPRVKGGYKALRHYLLDQLELNTNIINPVILGGRTGIGKTLLLNELSAQIDLEGIFNHRGSVFGKKVDDQPSQIDIENQLSIALLKQIEKQQIHLVFEDEAPNIGSRNIPKPLFEKMKQSPIVLLEEPVETRVDIIYDEYIVNSLAEHQAKYPAEQAFEIWAQQLIEALSKIQRRLGGERFKALNKIMLDAIGQHKRLALTTAHKDWIRHLLVDYYDPMYDYQLTKKTNRVVFRGSKEEIKVYLKSEFSII